MYKYHIDIGDRVYFCTDDTVTGTIKSIDRNLPDITTCVVVWDDSPDNDDIQWTNKLIKIKE